MGRFSCIMSCMLNRKNVLKLAEPFSDSNQGLSEKGNKWNVEEGRECWKLDLLAGYLDVWYHHVSNFNKANTVIAVRVKINQIFTDQSSNQVIRDLDHSISKLMFCFSSEHYDTAVEIWIVHNRLDSTVFLFKINDLL